jgi:hypothetical protein
MERIVVDQPREEDCIHLLRIELGHVVVAAILAQLRHWLLGELPGVAFRHNVGGEGAGGVRDVDDAALQRFADLERRHRLRPADIIDLDLAFAFGVDALDEFLEAARISCFLGKGRNGAKRNFLSDS